MLRDLCKELVVAFDICEAFGNCVMFASTINTLLGDGLELLARSDAGLAKLIWARPNLSQGPKPCVFQHLGQYRP